MPPASPEALRLAGLAALAGLSMALIGVAYQLAARRQAPATCVAAMMGLGGVAVFGVKALSGAGFHPSALVIALGVLGGATQYVTLRFIGMALARGPLTPLWCATNLCFLLPVAYAGVFLGEPPRLLQYVGIALGVAAVVAGSANHRSDPSHTPAARGRARVLYLLALLGALVFNSVLSVGIKVLEKSGSAGGPSDLKLHGDAFLLLAYGVMGLCIAVDLTVRRGWACFTPGVTACGLLAAASSVTALWAMTAAAALPSAILFTVTGVLAVMGAAVCSALFFGERANATWWLMMALCAGAVGLVNFG
jgi:drug/metabolite transporter (DMT)-like permease